MKARTDRDLWIEVWGLLEGAGEEPLGSNAGPYVEPVLRSTGNRAGDPWCAAQFSRIGRALFGDSWPLPNTASCDVILAAARRLGLLVTEYDPQAGDGFFTMKSSTDATHIGAVTKRIPDRSFGTGEGNAAPMGKRATREGTRVAKRIRGTVGDTNRYAFIRLFTADGALRA